MNLDATFSALADPTRRAILARLALGETSVTDLAKPFAMSMPAVSKHLKVLETAGLITRSREAQWRPCRIDPRALKCPIASVAAAILDSEGQSSNLDPVALTGAGEEIAIPAASAALARLRSS